MCVVYGINTSIQYKRHCTTSRAGNSCFHSTGSLVTEQSWAQPCQLGLHDMGHRTAASLSVAGAQHCLKHRLLHVLHGIDHSVIDNAIIDEWHGRLRACVQTKGGHFEQLLWQYSATRQESFQFLSNLTQFLDCFFCRLPQIRTFNFRTVVRQHTEGMVFSSLSSSEIMLKSR